MANKIYENIKMVTRYDCIADADLGYLELGKVPVPGSVAVFLHGELIQPESFDACGNPIISEEMTKFLIARQKLRFRNDPKNNSEDIYARVCYEPMKISSICPICGRKISMYDIRTKEFSRINGKHCHKKCLDNYNKALQFERMINLIDQVYDNNPKYTVIENPDYEFLTLLFETPDGNIKIEDAFGSVSIEWQENFKSFDIAIFETEQEMKWWYRTGIEPIFIGPNCPKNTFTNHIRGILARHDYNRAARYLQLAKEATN